MERLAVFFSNQAVDDRVEAAAGESQAVSQREKVCLSRVEGEADIKDVELDQDTPQREEIVREPADAE